MQPNCTNVQHLVSFSSWTSIGSQHAFTQGNVFHLEEVKINPYPLHYKAAFASSGILYPLGHPHRLRFGYHTYLQV